MKCKEIMFKIKAQKESLHLIETLAGQHDADYVFLRVEDEPSPSYFSLACQFESRPLQGRRDAESTTDATVVAR